MKNLFKKLERYREYQNESGYYNVTEISNSIDANRYLKEHSELLKEIENSYFIENECLYLNEMAFIDFLMWTNVDFEVDVMSYVTDCFLKGKLDFKC